MRSRRGSATLRLRITDAVPPGVAFAPFHWGALHLEAGATAVNAVTSRAVDPTSLQPELKACAIRVEPIRAAAAAAGGRRLVIVGAGMAGMAVADSVLAHDPSWQVTIVGREPDAPYNRVLLSQALAGDVADERLTLRVPERATLRLGAGVRALDTRAKRIELDDGATIAYDALVLATGSAPWLPPVKGIERAHVFRSFADMRAIRRAARTARTAVVVGGGLLGLEAARGLRELGTDVTVVHLADRLMELQLDPLAARLLERRIRALGITVLCSRRTEAVLDDGVALADGAVLPADLVVFATGIRPEVALARDAGLEVGRGVHGRRQPARERARRVGRGRVRRAPRHGLRAVGAGARNRPGPRARPSPAARPPSSARCRPPRSRSPASTSSAPARRPRARTWPTR